MSESSIKFNERDCLQVLSKYYNSSQFNLVKYSLVPISDEINGYMGKHLILKIQAKSPNNLKESLRFFVKTQHEDQAAMAEFIRTGNMFNKEVYCYKFLDEVKQECPDFDTGFVPRYYYSRENDCIVLEDLYDSGFSMTKGLELDMEHIKLALISLAKLHAGSIIFEEIKTKKLNREYRLLEDYGEWLEESMYRSDEQYLGHKYIKCGLKALSTLIDLLPPNKTLPASEFKEKLTNLVNKSFEDSKPSKVYRNVWCNGDIWAKNIMFEYINGKPVSCKIFDFQLQRYNPPAHDVFFMLYELTSWEEKRRHLHEYLDYYYNALKEQLGYFNIDINLILNRDEYDITCKLAMAMVKLSKTIYVSISAMSAESFNKLTSDADRYAKFTFEDRSEFVANLYKTEENYRNTLTALLEDLRDLLAHERITKEDCYKILKVKLGNTDYNLLYYEENRFAEKCGFLGEHCKLRIDICKNGCEEMHQFFVKSIPKEPGQRNFVLTSNLFFKEMKFYTCIVPKMLENGMDLIKECVADCYLARLNDVLVFEDYFLRGYRTLNPRISYDYDRVAAVVRKIAKFHASGLILEEKLSTSEKKYRIGEEYREQLNEPFYCTGKDNLNAMDSAIKGTLTHIDLFPEIRSQINSEVLKQRVAKAFYRKLEHVKPSEKYRNTICHGDLWAGNILFKFKDNCIEDCIFVDLQTIRYNPPAHDLISFIYLCTDRKFRSLHMSKVLDLYYSEISKYLKEYEVDVNHVLPHEEFLNSCEFMKEFSVTQSVNHFHNIMLTSEQIHNLFQDPEYGRRIMFEDRSPSIIKYCATDPGYKEKLKDCIIDFIEVCENIKDN